MANVVASFLGTGLLRPFVRDKKNDFANDSGVALVQSCVGQILGTRAGDPNGANQGELLWRPNFGSRLYLLRHARDEVIEALGSVYVKDALTTWEPRVTNVFAKVSFDRSSLTATIKLSYDIISKNNSQNRVVGSVADQTVTVPIAA